MTERWKETYDQWKLATPPEHEGSDEEEWRPCPFCGIDDLRMLEAKPSGRAVGCAACGAVGPSAEDAEEAVMNWNGRDSDNNEPLYD